jgi:Ser/Thr protein kinase RdoA (MazF antagonist)
MKSQTKLTSFSPILPVKDLALALDHYRTLGFATRAYDGGDEYGFADRDGIGLHLAAEPELAGSGETYLYVEDADALYAEWSASGVGGITRPVADTAYRLREGSHLDPDGNLIRFGSPYPEERWTPLRSHLEATYGIAVAGLIELDLGVYRVDRDDGPAWVARHFPASRPSGAAAGDAALLRYLADQDFPAERCATAEPVSTLDGRDVLVTEFVPDVPPGERKEAVRVLGGLRLLGDLLGRLHALPVPTEPGALTRPGGAWHHLAEGRPGLEVATMLGLLAAAQPLVPAGQGAAYESLRAALEGIDTCEGLPEALVHPDFVLANVVVSRQRGLVLVDWTGSGRGPRLWPLAFLLFAEGMKSLRRVDLVAEGYRRHLQLEPEELARLAGVVGARSVIFEAWKFCMGHKGVEAAAQGAAEARQLGQTIVARAQAAFAA